MSDLHIKYGAHTCKFIRPPGKEIEDVLRELTVYEPKGLPIITFRGGRRVFQDPKRYLYNRNTREFPTGLLTKVEQALRIPQVKRVQGSRATMFDVQVIIPRYYQIEAFNALVNSSGRGVAVLPTGTGKCGIAAMLASAYKESRIIITVPNRRLLHQNHV